MVSTKPLERWQVGYEEQERAAHAERQRSSRSTLEAFAESYPCAKDLVEALLSDRSLAREFESALFNRGIRLPPFSTGLDQ